MARGAAAAWECVIVGSGPAGLSAAVYMGRFRRRTLVLDCGDGRWSYGQVNDNYLGFPSGVSAVRLRDLGRAQARRFGVVFQDSEVTAVGEERDGFRLVTKEGPLRGRTVIWAAGVLDRWPDFTGARRLVGRHLFWCIVCDGWRARDERLLVASKERVERVTLDADKHSHQVISAAHEGAAAAQAANQVLYPSFQRL